MDRGICGVGRSQTHRVIPDVHVCVRNRCNTYPCSTHSIQVRNFPRDDPDRLVLEVLPFDTIHRQYSHTEQHQLLNSLAIPTQQGEQEPDPSSRGAGDENIVHCPDIRLYRYGLGFTRQRVDGIDRLEKHVDSRCRE